MRKKSLFLPTIFFLIWVLLPLFSPPLYAQSSKGYGGKTDAPPKEPDVVTKSVSGFLRNVVVLPRPHSVKVELIGDGLISAYQHFKLSAPPRLVVDFPHVFSSYPKKFIDVHHPLFTDIRFGQHPDKLRMVFNFPGTEVPSYEIRKEQNGLTIWIGKLEKDFPETQESGSGGKKEASPEKPPAGAAISQEKMPAERRGTDPEAKTPEETRVVYSDVKISLDYVNADIRNIFRFLADAGKVEIILAPEVQGMITLRLMEIPWDEALEAILKFQNLKMVREGNKIRILPP